MGDGEIRLELDLRLFRGCQGPFPLAAQALRAQDRWEREAETVPNTASDVREFDARFNEAQELHA